ncbi:uncharacterized protein LOC143020148 [Oratosquilla oratoria]|uniref:uncharacterized protein LOC143020148 n=1 Tax=Oratosquilla oratoria TaxID=337810 RepID=UPI003F75A2D2
MPPGNLTVPRPPPLQADAQFQSFLSWRRGWADYAAMAGVNRMPHDIQLMQLRSCLSLDVQALLRNSLDIPHDTPLSADGVLDRLQSHLRDSRAEALRRRDLFRCRQEYGEPFDDFYGRVKDKARELDLCAVGAAACAEAQMKTIILMGVRDEDLAQRISSLPTTATLQEVVTHCRSHESARETVSGRQDNPQVRAVSAYKSVQRQARASPPQPLPAPSSRPGDTCPNCGSKGHRPHTRQCPARNPRCRVCRTKGHWEKYCKSSEDWDENYHGPPSPGAPGKAATCRKVSDGSGRSPTPVSIRIRFGNVSSSLLMLPDTGADVTMIGARHLGTMGISKASLQPPTSAPMYMADGSQMPPTVGRFQATLTLGDRSCTADIRVHKGVKTPLLSFGHCRELAIIPPDFPKPILEVTYANRCAALTLPPDSSPAAARDYFLREFSDVLVCKDDLRSKPLGKMVGPPMRIHLKADAVPLAIHTPRLIPFAFRDQVKEELDSMVQQGIITPVGDEPSEWCHPMVLVAKNKGVRITVDLTKLNSQVTRPTHPSPTPFAAVRSVTPSARFFTTADALHGYWQIDLAEEDQHLTTFITPYGRYKHCRGPMGFAATGDAYCLRGDAALQGVANCVKMVDDVLLRNSQSPPPSVSFCGDRLSADKDKVRAIRDFPTPANLTDLRSFMGLVNQLADFTPAITAAAQPLRPLLSPKRSFTWTPDHDKAFADVKRALSSPPVLAPFDSALPVVLQTDDSRLYGIGYALLQDHGQGHLRLIQCGSRFLTDAETRYATIELEMLAVTWATPKCKLYLFGVPPFTLLTDHRPLIPILNSYTLDAVENPRLQRLKERLSSFVFTAKWCAGKQLCIPDALSQAPVSRPTPEDETDCDKDAAHVRSVVASSAGAREDGPSPDADRALQELRAEAQADPAYGHLLTCVSSGFSSNRLALPSSVLPYWKLRDALSTDGNLVLYGQRIVVPAALRKRTLARLHDSHRGTEATKRRARQTVFWPGIDSDIKSTVEACEPCQVLRPSQQQEPLLCDDRPTRPFESVSADFFHVAGKAFLVIADRLSGWPVIVPCGQDTTATRVIRKFCCYFRESNEHAEAAVKAAKHLILKTAPNGNIDCEEFDCGLLELRNAPSLAGRSSAQVLFGRHLRTCVPAHPKSFAPEWQARSEECDRKAAAHAAQTIRRYDEHARPLPALGVGQHVRIQDRTSLRWDKVGVIMGRGRSREYELRLPSGRIWWRNRRHLRPVAPPPDASAAVAPLPSRADPLPHAARLGYNVLVDYVN